MTIVLVSVLVTAHSRMQYLLQAVRSVVEQPGGDRCEIVVVKNFDNKNIDNELRALGVVLVNERSPSLGRKVAAGLRVTSGQVVCLLEDDDMFAPNKIATVKERFTANNELTYYHNNYLFIDAQGCPIKNDRFRRSSRNLLRKRGQIVVNGVETDGNLKCLSCIYPEFNNSCISIRRSALADSIDFLECSGMLVDEFIFFAGLASGGVSVIDSKVATYIRRHNENASGMGIESRSHQISRLSQLSTANVSGHEAVIAMMLERHRPDLERLARASYSVQAALSLLREPGHPPLSYAKAFKTLIRYNSTYPVQTRKALLPIVGLATLWPRFAQIVYQAMRPFGAG